MINFLAWQDLRAKCPASDVEWLTNDARMVHAGQASADAVFSVSMQRVHARWLSKLLSESPEMRRLNGMSCEVIDSDGGPTHDQQRWFDSLPATPKHS